MEQSGRLPTSIGGANFLLIIINGAPGTGKTILGRKLSQELSLPLLSRDDIKESLFDNLGWRDHAWSEKLGGVSYEGNAKKIII